MPSTSGTRFKLFEPSPNVNLLIAKETISKLERELKSCKTSNAAEIEALKQSHAKEQIALKEDYEKKLRITKQKTWVGGPQFRYYK